MMRWLQLVWLAPLVMGLGCGGTVEVNTGGSAGAASTANGGSGVSGSSGSGGAGASSGSAGSGASAGSSGGIGGGGSGGSMVTSSGGAGSGGSAGSGGGTVCDQACDFAETCGLPGGLCGMYLDCGTMQGTCFAKCVTAPGVDCAAIFAALQGQPGPITACVQGCQNGSGGSGGSGTGGMGGSGPAPECQQCGQDNCTGAVQQCAQQAGFQECQAWVNCVGNCSDSACVDDCTAMHPGGAVIEQCACTSCAMECSGICSGSGSGGSGGAGGTGGMGGAGGSPGDPMACQQCGQQQCGAEVQQCFGAGINACQAWLNCTQSCMDKACIDQCSVDNPAGAALGTCICSECDNIGCGYTCD
jgi:hypothetical protein